MVAPAFRNGPIESVHEGSFPVWRCIALLSILFATVSCAHLNRVSGGALDRLTRNGDQFVLKIIRINFSKSVSHV